ncbi:BPSL0761 family protein [Pseudomonas fluorescens]|uniref:BPSL0761 family protein n=1 Tax=Pseudomonas fluorescens TaxID=294 RepID=UPI0038573D2B
MTLADKRKRSLIHARDFLIDLSGDHTVPERVRLRAFQLLRHYPAPSEILSAESNVQTHCSDSSAL